VLTSRRTQTENQRGLADAAWREHQEMATLQLAPCTSLFLFPVKEIVTFNRITDTDLHGNLHSKIFVQQFCFKSVLM
jgi:hypothetical protein